MWGKFKRLYLHHWFCMHEYLGAIGLESDWVLDAM